MIYLASQYSHEDKHVMEVRYEMAVEATAVFTKKPHRKLIYSPIVHYHDVARLHDLPTDAAFWWHINKGMLNLATELWVLTEDKWYESVGVMNEIEHAKKIGLPVTYCKLNGTRMNQLGDYV